jgi:uncharacterized protein
VKAEPYGNWESTGLDGHIGGHYLTALALFHAATGDREALERLNYMVAELGRAQAAHGNGYIGGVPNGEATWAEIAAGDIRADLFSLNGRWVPWYNLHKVYAGLRDAYVHAGNEQALRMLVALTDWSERLVAGLSDEQVQTMLRTEHGGMNEVFADVAALTGDARYLDLARRFSHRLILDPLLAGEDRLTGLHANTQIPKVVGYKRVADVAAAQGQPGFQAWDDASAFFWRTVVDRRSVAIGGNSVREHFHPADDFTAMMADREGPETCNTYNMLRLSGMLFQTSPSGEYMDYYERALYNHILSSQHPEHGGLVYFTSMRPGHYRVYSQPDLAMWCCVGSGIENHAKYGEMLYAHRGDELYVNLFIPSTLDWRERNTRIEQRTGFPDEERTEITIQAPARFTLNLRYPGWVAPGELVVEVNGRRERVDAAPGEYVAIRRAWRAGDRVTVTLPMRTHVEPLPDGSPHYAVLHGPIVLAAQVEPFGDEDLVFLADDSRMGHIATGPLCPSDAAPVFVTDEPDFLSRIRPAGGGPLTFRATTRIGDRDRDLELVPFFRVHDSRYVVYWRHYSPTEYRAEMAVRAEAERARMALEAATIDRVAPGEQQPEAEHGFRGEDTEAGVTRDRHWRRATGWFGYDLVDRDGEAAVLRVTYHGMERGREFDIVMNEVPVATVRLDGGQGDVYFQVDYPVPASVLERAVDGRLMTWFVAHPGSATARIYDVRLLRADAPPAGSTGQGS